MNQFLRLLAGLALFCLLPTCVDPVEPVFQFETGFLLIEGRITDNENFSEIRVSRSEIRFGQYTLAAVEGARVNVVDQAGNETVWEPVGEEGRHRPPADWVAQTGNRYFARITTPAGEIIESEPEVLPARVPLEDLRVDFQQEAYFSDSRERFVPAFRLLVDLDDPVGERNYYQYRFRAYEQLDICARCFRSRYRNGDCIADQGTRFIERYDYFCDGPCWSFADGTNFYIFSDEFTDGRRLEDLEVGRYDYDWRGGLLFQLQQYSISQAAYEYNRVLRDLTENGGGLNAPLPAALVGNLRDVSAVNTDVLGFVGVAAVAGENIFFNRDTIDGNPLPFDASIRPEPVMGNSAPLAPCEGPNRTTEEPAGWQN